MNNLKSNARRLSVETKCEIIINDELFVQTGDYAVYYGNLSDYELKNLNILGWELIGIVGINSELCYSYQTNLDTTEYIFKLKEVKQ